MGVVSLLTAAAELRSRAANSSSRRAARTLLGGSDRVLRQTMVAFCAGAELAEHENPGEASLQILVGEVDLRTGEHSQPLVAGDQIQIPEQLHSLHATSDAVVLLTVAKPAAPTLTM